jgi:signal peptidase II
VGVSCLAVFFIISLYSRLHNTQTALKWGLPLVLGGALGNLSDRITRSQVIDFIDYRADWVMSMNSFIKQYVSNWTLTDHWPTFNVADVGICVGVILMGVDMFTHRPGQSARKTIPPSEPGTHEQLEDTERSPEHRTDVPASDLPSDATAAEPVARPAAH